MLEWFKQNTIKLRAVALISNDRFETIAHKQVEMEWSGKILELMLEVLLPIKSPIQDIDYFDCVSFV